MQFIYIKMFEIWLISAPNNGWGEFESEREVEPDGDGAVSNED